jgi:hypothetical protein
MSLVNDPIRSQHSMEDKRKMRGTSFLKESVQQKTNISRSFCWDESTMTNTPDPAEKDVWLRLVVGHSREEKEISKCCNICSVVSYEGDPIHSID